MSPAPLRYRAMEPGSGRNGGAVKRAVHVEDLDCPRGGKHVLVNSAQRGGLVTACSKCKVDWTTLDAIARKARGQ